MEPTSNDNPARQQQPPPPPPPPPALQPPPPHRKCPRCDSPNTKFCYYNNYSLTQPRHFCKACRRYWTHGGTLRNVPIGGGCRKNKRSSKASSSSLPSRCQNPAAARTLPPPSMSTSFFGGAGGGVFFPAPYAAMQASPAAGVNLGGGGGSGGQFGANLSLLQAMSLQSLKSPAAANQFQPPGNLFPAQPNLMNPAMRPWAQNTAAGSSSSAGGSSFWNSVTGVGDQAGPSFSGPNQWPTTDNNNNNNPGFNPSQQ